MASREASIATAYPTIASALSMATAFSRAPSPSSQVTGIISSNGAPTKLAHRPATESKQPAFADSASVPIAGAATAIRIRIVRIRNRMSSSKRVRRKASRMQGARLTSS